MQKFDDELRKQERFVDKLVLTAEKILASCHPDAKREVSYHLRALRARWQQVWFVCVHYMCIILWIFNVQ